MSSRDQEILHQRTIIAPVNDFLFNWLTKITHNRPTRLRLSTSSVRPV